MKFTSLVLLALAPILLLACKDKAPCSGGGMVVDERELSPVLKDVIGPGTGTMCRAETETAPNTTDRHYEIAKVGPAEALDLWDQHMKSKGWVDVTSLPMLTENIKYALEGKGCGLVTQLWAKEGVTDRVEISVSFCVDDVGWTSLHHHACTERTSENCK